MTGADVLIYAEDPGAANYVAGLRPALADFGLSCALLADGEAAAHLAALGELYEACPPGAHAAELLAARRPRLVLCGTAENRDTLGSALIDEARARGIPTLGAVDGPSHPAERFSGRTGRADGHAPDRILVPDSGTAEAFHALGFARARVDIAGHPHFDRVRAERARLDAEGRAAVRQRLFPGCHESRTLAVFLGEISDGMAPALYRRAAHWTLAGRGGSPLRTHVALEEFLDASAGLGWHRVLRLHPKDRAADYARYAAELDSISSGGAPYDLVYAADIVAGLTTFLLVEAAILGRPTLSVLPDAAQAAWLPSAAAGIARVAFRRDDLSAVLRAGPLAPPDPAVVDRAFPAGAARNVAQIAASML
jgi:hypothetical protein